MVVRENLEGLYVGHESYIRIDDDPHAVAMATDINTRQGSGRLIEYAFEHAIATGRKKVTIAHKANILKALTGIFLETGVQLYEQKYQGKFELETMIVDACAMKLVLNPWQFDMVVATNLFGDVLSDLVAGLVGGLGMAPGGNIGADAAISRPCMVRRRTSRRQGQHASVHEGAGGPHPQRVTAARRAGAQEYARRGRIPTEARPERKKNGCTCWLRVLARGVKVPSHSFWTLLYRYFFFDWLFKDARRGVFRTRGGLAP